MKFKVIQINIWMGKYIDELVDFLTLEKPDFICAQEVSTNEFNFSDNKNISIYEELKRRLSMHAVYHGDIKLDGDSESVSGNAVFSKYSIVDKKVLTLNKYRPVTKDEIHGPDGYHRERLDRNLLDAVIDVDGVKLHVLSWHGAWTAPPQDTKRTLGQARMIKDYLRNLKDPFILGADTNNIIGSKTIDGLDEVSINILKGTDFTYSTNPKNHKAMPKKYLVDFIFVSKDIKVKSVEIPQVTISDHLPMIAKLEI